MDKSVMDNLFRLMIMYIETTYAISIDIPEADM
jgi:hypothetical protein